MVKTELEQIIAGARVELDRQKPPFKTGRCPFCGSAISLKRHGGINRYAFRTEIYYTEIGEHKCDWEPPMPKPKGRKRKPRAKKAKAEVPTLPVQTYDLIG